MGYLSCDADSAIKVCDPYNWDYYRRKKPNKNKPRKTRSNLQIRQFRYADILSATNDFSSGSFLGKGSHGSVYRAVLDDGKLITAVKKTSKNCNSPADNEVEILSRVYHPRLVNLIGYCSESLCNNKLIVVEYMPNGSLYDLLHSSCRPPGWTTRVRFALQVAKAVQALHSGSPPVIHRDIKSSNVLIDRRWTARLGDFGLALIGHVEDVRVKYTPPAGTLGYLDPGYLAPSDVSTKSDVFSFGILLLEIISGRHAIDLKYSPPSVVDWAVPLIKGGDFASICDGRVGPPVDKVVIRSLAVLAARCVRSVAERRPKMEEVVECLTAVSKRVNAGTVWSNLRQRVRCVEKPSVKHRQVFEGSEEAAARSSRCGSRRSSQRVSSVTSEVNVIGDGVLRSKSIGSFAEAMKMGPTEIDLDGGHVALARKKPAKSPTVKLSKSRSMGVLQSPKLMNLYGKQLAAEVGKGRNSSEFDMSKLVISFDDGKSRKILEKPLFFV